MRRIVATASLVVLAAACSVRTGIGGAPDPPPSELAIGDGVVTVASFDFDESELLAELYAQALERSGVRVERQLRLGPRELVEPALERGLVELVPEYAGSLLEFLIRRRAASADLADVRGRLDDELSRRGLLALASADAQDRNAFATTLAFATANRVASLSDLAAIGPVTVGGPPECPARPLCLPGIEERYDVEVGSFVALDLSGPLTADALARGVVDVALVLTTSPVLDDPSLFVLADDRELQPAENVTPIVHADLLGDVGPHVREMVDRVSGHLTTSELRDLNVLVTAEGVPVPQAAADWLDAHGFPGAGP